jgi:small nuclear ribonucleoprotein (snRNP)-like protein
MKNILLTLLFFLCLSDAMAQSIKPRIAILKTQNGKYKGILYKVDSINVVLNHDGEFINIPINEIKTVQIRTIKKGYKGTNFIKVGDDPGTVYKTDSRGKMIDQWGNEQPSLEGYASTPVFSVVFTALANGIAAPIHAINPNIARFNLKKQENNQLNELSYYSIYYQANPNVLAELRKMKDISSTFKP